MPQLPLAAAVDYVLGRAQQNNALLGWTDDLGQGWNVSVIGVTASDSSMVTRIRLRFDPIILITLIPDGSRQSQQFDIGISARDTVSGSVAPPSWT